jgi:type IV pilus assembly protein PilM
VFRKRVNHHPAVVGLDLDPSHVAAVELVPDGTMAIKRSALTRLRPGVVRDGELVDPAALTETLRELFTDSDLPTRVRIGLANQRIVVRTMDLEPLLDEKALAAAVQAKAADHIPMPMDEAVVDHQRLGVVNTPEGPRTRVVIVAVRREVVERLAHAAAAAGLSIEGIDLAAFAMVRAVGSAGAGARLYLNVAGLTNVAVAGEDGVFFARAAAGGLETLAHTLSERRALTLEHAHQWMVHVGMTAPLAEVEGDRDLVAATRAVLEEGVHEIADAVRGSVEFYRMQESASPVEEGVLTGAAVAVPGFADALGERLRLPLTIAAVQPAGGEDAGLDLGRLTVAAGLAVEERDLRAA